MADSRRSADPPGAEDTPVAGAGHTISATEVGIEPSADAIADTLIASPMVDPAAPEGPGLPAGAAVGRYAVLEKVGAGAMGVVYAAYDHRLDRRVALKLLRDPERRWGHRRLQREAQALARLSHPNVIAVHDIDQYRDQLFVAMEYVEGSTLREWLAREPRTWREVLEVFRRAGEGLAAAHAVGIVHRDFKPDNVLIDRRGRVRVGDFGLALVARDTELDGEDPDVAGASAHHAALTATGATLGTPAYMAPEQHAGERAIDGRADQFSFCAALYESLYGERPFAGETQLALHDAIVSGAIREPPRGREVPVWLHRAVVRGLAREPDARHPSMDALLAELSRDRPARRRLIAGGAGLVAALVAGGVGLGAATGWFADDRDPCPGATERMAGVWDEARQREVSAAFLASGAPGAALQLAATRRHLDHYADRWLVMHTDSCRATNVRGEQSAALLDLRTHCLDQRLGELRALTALLRHADPAVVAQATEASRQLRPIDSCANTAELSGEIRPPDSAALRAVQERYGAVRAAMLAGRWKEAMPLLRAIAADARAAGDRPLEAAALVDLVHAVRMAGDSTRLEDVAYEALAAAEAGRAGETAVRAWLELMHILRESGNRYDEAHRVSRLARSTLERIGSPGLLEAALEDGIGGIYMDQGKPTEARPHIERGLALREKSGEPPELSEVATSLSVLAMLEARQGHHDRSFQLHQRAYQVLGEALGPEHPDVVRLMLNDGAGLSQQGRLDEALALFQRGLDLTRRGEGPRSVLAATFHNNIAVIYEQRKQYERARAELDLTRSVYSDVFGPKSTDVAGIDIGLASILIDMRRYDEALALLEPATDVLVGALGAKHPDVVEALQMIGRDHLEANRAARAIAPLERALAICEVADTSPADRAETQYLLAQALHGAHRERARALSLAMQSRAGFTADEDTDSLNEVNQWIARRYPRAAAARRGH
jgi:eukaryotic-like serine/threonine-protein kinase